MHRPKFQFFVLLFAAKTKNKAAILKAADLI